MSRHIPLRLLALPLLVLALSCESSSREGGMSGMRKHETPSGPPPQANARMQQVLDSYASLNPKPLPKLSPEEARKQPTPADAVKALLKKEGKSTEPQPVGNVTDRTIPGAGGEIPVRIYTPKGNGPFPVLVYYHGGGWVIATIDTYDASARALCNAANCVVVSVEYRKAPEHPFPAAADDAFAAYQWVTQNAASINGDPKRIAVAGESAGGNLAAVTAMMAREKAAPMPVYQVLIYPVANHDFHTESYMENANAKPLGREAMMWFYGHYLKDPAQADDPRASILKAEKLSKLPPATIITAEIDPLRSEGKMYAEKLREAGVDVRYRNFEDVTHEFFGMGAVLPEAKQAVQFAAEGLKQAFKK